MTIGAIDLRADLASLSREQPATADPADPGSLLELLRTLHAIGRRDLPLGRLFEGHVDALQIVSRYGSPVQSERVDRLAHAGELIAGVWNADLMSEPLTLDETSSTLSGGKSFASGAGILTHALVTVDLRDQRQLILVDLARSPPAIDHGWWRTAGMQRSETHVARWPGVAIEANDLIGEPGDYTREPWFSGGALRFAAVQAGGIAALCDGTRDHLVGTGRAADPHQAGRLAALYLAAQSAADAVTRAAAAWFDGSDEQRSALVAAARMAVYEAGGHALTLAQEAVGVQALFVDHPLAAVITDLMVYLRQPGPDAQRMRLGAAVAAGTVRPCL